MKGKIVGLAVVLLIGILFSGCSMGKGYEPIDEAQIVFYQLEPMKQGEDIALVETSMGNFKMRFFPSEAPKAVENFITLAEDGFYDGQEIFIIQKDVDSQGNPVDLAFAAGSETSDGMGGKTIYNNKLIENEISYNLWHFPGAVSAMSHKRGKVNSIFCINGDLEVEQNIIDQMKSAQYPKKVIDKFKELGGIPAYSLTYPIFAQVYEGLDVINGILKQPVDQNRKPVESIKIKKVTISQY